MPRLPGDTPHPGRKYCPHCLSRLRSPRGAGVTGRAPSRLGCPEGPDLKTGCDFILLSLGFLLWEGGLWWAGMESRRLAGGEP